MTALPPTADIGSNGEITQPRQGHRKNRRCAFRIPGITDSGRGQTNAQRHVKASELASIA
jgi:hypothetical protein